MYKFAINKPISTLMLVMSFIVFGLISYERMPINLFPNVEFPIVTIQTTYYGADPQTVESKVTDKIEEAVSGIDGIDKLMSTSYAGMSVVTVVFKLERDITEAANDVRDKVGAVSFSNDIEKPIIKKSSSTASAVISLFVSTKNNDWQGLMRLSDEKLKPRLQRIRGVSEINIVGFRKRQIRIFTNPFLLNKYHVSASDLQNIIASENIRAGGGKLVSKKNEFVLKVRADAITLKQVKNIRILPGVRLQDIAKVEDDLADAKSYSSYNSKSGVIMQVKKISGTNTLDIINGIKKILPDLQEISGKNFELKLLQDQSDKILQNIHQVTFDLIYGAFLSIIIVFFFLRNITVTFVSALAIPTSIIGTFAIIDWLGYDLNRLTMIGLTLAIGIFIDDAIVVIENITKKMEKGLQPFEASYEGIKEIAFSILAISAMLLSVFIPVAFMSGIVGKFFNSFAMTVAAGIVISYTVAVMFIPAMSARVLNAKKNKFYHLTEPFFVKLDTTYTSILRVLIRYKSFTILGAIGILVLSFLFVSKVGGDFVPMEDNSEFEINIKAPVGINLETMKEKMTPILKKIQEDPLVKYNVLTIGYTASQEIHKARIYVRLVPVEKRDLRQEEVVQKYRKEFKNVKGLKIVVQELPIVDAGLESAKVQIVLTGSDLGILEKKSKEVEKLLANMKGPVGIDSDFEEGKPEIRITLKRENAKRLGVNAREVVAVIGAAFSSDIAISSFEQDGREYDITLRLSNKNRKSIEDMKKLQVKTSSGKLVFLDGVVNFEQTYNPASINRFDRERKILVKSNLFGVPLNSVVENIQGKLQKIMNHGYHYRFTGDIEHMQDTYSAFGMAVLLAVILIYLILSALYESLIQPFIIMIAMPLSFTGVIFGLYLFHMPFSLFVMIGVILLLGMVGKNAILVVDFANQSIKDGKEVDEALLEAGEKRLRPILMTTFAMIGAMLPLALGNGAGHEGNAPMAVAIIGGLISSTILTLLVVPALYKFMYPLDKWLRKWYEKGKV
jgi:hydrophobic/amphiphilic exporter-1 (mainly G- bacteria), HAE1 family